MKYLNSYNLFMEDKRSKVDIENLEKDLKNKGIDPNDEEFQQKLAKNLTDQLKRQIDSNNPDIKVDLEEVVKESLDNKIFESHSPGIVGDILHIWHEIETNVITNAENAEIVGHDVLHKIKSDNIVVKFFKELGKVGGWILNLFETVIIWISRNIFKSSALGAIKTTKWVMAGLAIAALIASVKLWPSALAGVLAGGGFWILLPKMIALGKTFISTVSGIWKVIKSGFNIDKVDSGEKIITLPEFIDYIESSYNISRDFGSKSIQKSNAWQSHLKDDQVKELSNIFKSMMPSKEKPKVISLQDIPYLNYHAGLSDKESKIEDLFDYLTNKMETLDSSSEKSEKDEKSKEKQKSGDYYDWTPGDGNSRN